MLSRCEESFTKHNKKMYLKIITYNFVNSVLQTKLSIYLSSVCLSVCLYSSFPIYCYIDHFVLSEADVGRWYDPDLVFTEVLLPLRGKA